MKEREIALYALLDITEDAGFAGAVLQKRLENEDARTQGFVRRVVYGVLDRVEELDGQIDRANRSGRKRLDPKIRQILRLSLYQLRYMDKTAAHGVINDAVKLAKKTAPRYAGFVNGMLRTLQRTGGTQKTASLPDPVRSRLEEIYGAEYVQKLQISLTDAPHLCVRMNPLKAAEEDLARAFARAGMTLVPSPVTPGVFRVLRPRNVFSMPEFSAGLFTAQDEASAQVVLHAHPKPGQHWIDLCAAPGGKSTQLAEQMKDTGSVLANDLTERKVSKIRAHAKRLQLTSLSTHVQDAGVYVPRWKERFDGVLVDAPCSGLGLLRRKPDIKIHRSEEDIRTLVGLQERILAQAARYVRPGGVLLYSTCTLLPEENERQVQSFLEKHEEFTPDGADFQKRTDMLKEGADGFYMARMRKNSARA